MRSLALKAHKQAPAPLLLGLSAREKEAEKLFPQRGRFAAADIFRISQHLNLEAELAEALGLVQSLWQFSTACNAALFSSRFPRHLFLFRNALRLKSFLFSFALLPDLFANNTDAPTTFPTYASHVDGTLPISAVKQASQLDDDILAGKREGARRVGLMHVAFQTSVFCYDLS
jgi:hypothetical protein